MCSDSENPDQVDEREINMINVKLTFILIFLFIWNAFSAWSMMSPQPGRQAMSPRVQQAIAEANQRRLTRTKCDSTYGQEIRKRTGDLQKKMMDLVQKEKATATTKHKKNAKFTKMQNDFKKIKEKHAISYKDTTANGMKRRKAAELERRNAIKKLQDEERKMNNDPELLKIRQSITAIRKQIDDTISVIVKDQTCLECYKPRR
jgi:hypothetical protein